jgi:hypothetical protein
MKSILFFIVTLFLHNQSNCQNYPPAELDSVYACFAKNVLLDLAPTYGKTIVVPFKSSKLALPGPPTFFWEKLTQYFQSTDSAYLIAKVGSYPGFRLPKDWEHQNIVFMDTVPEAYAKRGRLQVTADYIGICLVSNFVFSPDKQRCVILYGLKWAGDTTVELKKVNGKWIVAYRRADWMQ